MHGFEVNFPAVLAAAVARFAIGGVWYAPFAFGNYPSIFDNSLLNDIDKW